MEAAHRKVLCSESMTEWKVFYWLLAVFEQILMWATSLWLWHHHVCFNLSSPSFRLCWGMSVFCSVKSGMMRCVCVCVSRAAAVKRSGVVVSLGRPVPADVKCSNMMYFRGIAHVPPAAFVRRRWEGRTCLNVFLVTVEASEHLEHLWWRWIHQSGALRETRLKLGPAPYIHTRLEENNHNNE